MPLTEDDIHKEALAQVAINGETKWRRLEGIVEDVAKAVVYVRMQDDRLLCFKQGCIRVIDRE